MWVNRKMRKECQNPACMHVQPRALVGADHLIGPRRRALGHRIRQRRRTECRPSSGGTSSYSPACKRTEKTRDKCPNPVCACKHDPIPISISVTDDTRYGYMDPRRPMRSVTKLSPTSRCRFSNRLEASPILHIMHLTGQ